MSLFSIPTFCLLLLFSVSSFGKSIAYIHGDVAANGTIPSGSAAAYDQMLLTDSGNTGLSQFKALVESQGYAISQHYDQSTILDAAFLKQFDAVIFGLHQKVWSLSEQTALDNWLKEGGGILMYSDSAAGGLFSSVGIKNQIGQTAVNSILGNYGMQVAVDQGGGTRAYQPDSGSPNSIVWDQPIFEGEGVSPVAVDPNGPATVLIPLAPANRVSNGALNIDPVGVTISNPNWAVIAHSQVEKGNVIAIFDRQPIWNNGPGSDINEEDNEEVLRRLVRFLARDYGNSLEWFQFQCGPSSLANFEISYRQWSGGSGESGFDYIARNNKFTIEQQSDLGSGGWRVESSLVETLATIPFGDNESEIVSLRLLPDNLASRWFARLAVRPELPLIIPSVSVAGDQLVTTGGTAWLEGQVTNASSQTWSKLAGPGTVSFDDSSSAQTTATFSQAGTYELLLTASSINASFTDTLLVTVVESADVHVAINCGGSAYSGKNGISYSADQFFDGGGVDNFPNNPVANTDDDEVFNTARSKGDFTGYSIPATTDDYLVYLQLSETFWTDANKRVFDLSIEGSPVIEDLDLYASAGKWVALPQLFPSSVSDGILNIDVSASVNNPLINALVVVRAP